MTKIVKVSNDEWFSIKKEKAGQQGYYFVEDLGYWTERDREVYRGH